MNKTQEELKQEFNELTEEDLTVVTGGSSTDDAPQTVRWGNFVFSNLVNKYAENHKGEMLYLVKHDGSHYFYGTLLDSFEEESTFTTERKQVLAFIEYDNMIISNTVEKSGDDYGLYRTKEIVE